MPPRCSIHCRWPGEWSDALVVCRCWGAGHQQLAPGLMKTPTELLAFCQGLPAWSTTCLLSLVPTQLARLLAHPDGVAFCSSYS